MTDPLKHALSLLPHGPEFRFIDALTALDPGKSGSATYTVRGDEPFLRGHMPGEPLFPGVLLIEAAAQLSGIVAQSDPSRTPLRGLKLTAVRSAKILGTARVGETIHISAQITGRFENLVQSEATIWVTDKEVLKAALALCGSV